MNHTHCGSCHGTGRVTFQQKPKTCPWCYGTGGIDAKDSDTQ